MSKTTVIGGKPDKFVFFSYKEWFLKINEDKTGKKKAMKTENF